MTAKEWGFYCEFLLYAWGYETYESFLDALAESISDVDVDISVIVDKNT